MSDNDPQLPAPINIADVATMSREELRGFISNVELAAEAADGIQVEIPIQHYHSKGVYAREMKLDQGTLIVGKIHKYENLNILSAGEVTVISIDGCVRVKAPYTIVASPGAKRIIYAHEECVWTTIHGTDEKDIDKIENEFIAKTYEDVPSIGTKESKCLG